MEIGKLPMAIVGITIAVIVCAVLLIPVVQESTVTENTFINDGYYHMVKYTSDDEITMVWDYSEPDILTVNDVDYELTQPDDGNFNQTVLFGSNSGARLYYNHSGCQYMQGSGTTTADLFDGEILTVTCISGTMTGTVTKNGETISTLSDTYDYIYVVSGVDGDYVMKKSGTPAYVLKDSEFIGFGISNVAGSQKILRVEGSIDDGATVTQITTSPVATYSEPVIDATAVNGYNDLYSLTKVTFTGTYNDTTTNVTYSYFVVPAKVTAELTNHPTSEVISLLNVIPILVIIGIVMLAVTTMIYYRR